VVCDPYARLRPDDATPDDEICQCVLKWPIMLLSRLGENPLVCAMCRGEVDPAKLPLPASMVDKVAHWRVLENAFLQLWLDSGEYEAFAQDELLNPESPINREGLQLRGELESVRRCYFAFFQKFSYETWEYEVPKDCPLCHGDLVADTRGRGDLLVCESCGICFINLNGANPLIPIDEWNGEH
jgi:hypothetical protein